LKTFIKRDNFSLISIFPMWFYVFIRVPLVRCDIILLSRWLTFFSLIVNGDRIYFSTNKLNKFKRKVVFITRFSNPEHKFPIKKKIVWYIRLFSHGFSNYRVVRWTTRIDRNFRTIAAKKNVCIRFPAKKFLKQKEFSLEVTPTKVRCSVHVHVHSAAYWSSANVILA